MVVNHGGLLLPGVAQALEKAKNIHSKVARGEMKTNELTNPNLRAFFSTAELKELYLDEIRESAINKIFKETKL